MSPFIKFVDRHAGMILSFPALALLGLFVILPFCSAIYDSFTNQSLLTILNPGQKQYVGLHNYRELVTSDSFISAFRNTVYFVAVVVPCQTVLALVFAVVVNGADLWRKVLRTCFFLPVITSMAVLSVVWQLLYHPSDGFFNTVLKWMGLAGQPFLDSPGQALNCLIVMSIWQGVGFQMMLFLGGLQSIPNELYEVARIERASVFQRFWHITLPLLKDITIFVVFITVIFAFKLFVQPHMITHGGPQGATETLILLLYDEAFTNGRYGMACAISVVFFVIVLSIALCQRIVPKMLR